MASVKQFPGMKTNLLKRMVRIFLYPLLRATEPKFLGPYGMDTAGCYPMPWDADAHWEQPSRLHKFLLRIAGD